MGCCCSVDEDVVKAEKHQTNPLDPHADWAAKMVADVGTDAFAIPRDFPRMHVMLMDPDASDESVTTVRRNDSHKKMSLSAVSAEKLSRVKEVIVGIASICGESDTIGAGVTQWWDDAQQPAAETASLFHQPDASPLIRTVMIHQNMVTRFGFEDDEIAAAAAGDNKRKEFYRANCKTFRIMEFLVQGVVFFPVQRIQYLLWFPWVGRFTDSRWTSYVFTRPSFPEHIYVVHRQLSRNFVERDNQSSTPMFEFEWDLVVTLHSATGNFVASEIVMKRVTVKKSDSGSLLCCWKSSQDHLREARIAMLSQRVMDTFSIEVMEES